MELSKIISIDKKFKSSVNLEYDLNNIEKIIGYIPTEQSVKVIDRFLRSIYYAKDENNKRANILVGPYGRGKSHLLLVLSALLSFDCISQNKSESKKALTTLIKKINLVNPETGALAQEILNTKIRLLPVIINSNGVDINQSLILAIRDALERAGLLNLLPSTHFDAALDIVAMWENNYPEAFKKLCLELKNRKATVEELKIKLGQYNPEAYTLFCEVYPLIAAGTSFNPYANTDIIKLYHAVNKALKEQTAFKGLFIVFDEFSKFIEANLDKSKMQNFKVIQDLAEAADRESDPQMHFVCVTHKSMLDYSASDSFKTVEGRFSEVKFVASSEQSYELIANAILKKKEFEQFKKEHRAEFKRVKDDSARTEVFSDLSEETLENKLVYGCFPIAPLTAYSLLRVSEKVGQNERTIFTFLAQKEEGTLVEFLTRNSGFSLMTIECVFDYFKDLFKKSVFNSVIHSMWAKADSALYQTDEKVERDIIKALAIIGIIGDEKLRPESTHLKAALNLDEIEFKSAIQQLMNKMIIAQRESSEYVLLTANGVDVQNNVANYVNTKAIKINRCEILDTLLENKYLLPRQYNDEYSMIRYFRVKFMEANEFLKIKNAQQVFDGDDCADGIILNILSNSTEVAEQVTKKVGQYNNDPHLIICVPQGEEFDDLLIKQLYAVRQLKLSEEAKIDKHYLEELEIFEEDIRKRLVNKIDDLYSADGQFSKYYNCNGELQGIQKQVHLNKELSKICRAKYPDTPKINNELINKNNLTAPIKKARTAIIEHLFENSDAKEIPDISGYGPEATIFKAVFKTTGLYKSRTCEDAGFERALDIIRVFVRNAENAKQDFQRAYKMLLSPPYGIRKGIIPLLFAYVLKDYKEKILLYFGKNEIELSAENLSIINDVEGDKYQLLLESGTQLKERAVDSLREMFASYGGVDCRSLNKVYNVVRCMQNWMRALPEYTKKCTKVVNKQELVLLGDRENIFRKELLKFELNSREFLFEKIFDDNTETGYNETIQWVQQTKTLYDNHISSIKQYLIEKTTTFFVENYMGSLASSMMYWREKLSEGTKQRIFKVLANQLLSYVNDLTVYDDEKIIVDLAQMITGVNIVDWNDKTLESYLDTIQEVLSEINEYDSRDHNDAKENTIEISINGTVVTKKFSSVEYSPLGLTFMDNLESTLDDYADSVSPDEKLSILLELIKKIVD